MEIPLFDMEISLFDMEIPLFDMEIPLFDMEIPLSEMEIPRLGGVFSSFVLEKKKVKSYASGTGPTVRGKMFFAETVSAAVETFASENISSFLPIL